MALTEIKILPMSWGECPKCKCNLDEILPSQIIVTRYAVDGTIESQKLLRTVCNNCDYILWIGNNFDREAFA